MFVIDYTQYALYEQCPWAWYERYVNAVRRDYGNQRRSDSLALGTLVHAGLQHFDTHGTPDIPQSAIAEVNPTPATLHLATAIVTQYAAKVSHKWPFQRLENVVTRPLTPDISLAAKIDRYFYVPCVSEIPDGIGGTIHLSPGYWIEEHKTTSQPRNAFYQRWLMDIQADFQMLALAHHIGHTPVGVLVNAIEKPSTREPVRTCQQCQATHNYHLYLPTDDDHHRCPSCGHVQKLSPLKSKPLDIRFYRVVAVRSSERLEASLATITHRATEMAQYASQPMPARHPSLTRCVQHYYVCEYLPPHSGGLQALGFPGYTVSDPQSYLRDDTTEPT